MKIAICFFGITRNLGERSLRSIEECLFAPVRRVDPHFQRFGHFNLPGCIHNPRSKEFGAQLSGDDHLLLRCSPVATTPQEEVDRQIDLASYEQYGDPWKDGFVSLKNLLRQYYSLQQVTQLLVESREQFDVVIYSRADVLYRRRLKLPKVEAGCIYTPRFGKWGGLNDRFALGDQQTMVRYGLRGVQALEYVATTGQPLHAEQFLEWYVRRNAFTNVDLDVLFWRIRANGKVAPLDGRLRHLYGVYGWLKRLRGQD